MIVPEPDSNGELEPAVVYEIAQAIRTRDDFLILGHLRPDGDCLGSCLGLYHMLSGMGKKVRFYTAGPLPDIFRFLPGFDQVETEPPDPVPPVCIYVDSGDPERVSEEFQPLGFTINIDHHLSNTHFGALNWVDTEATAAGEQIYRLALVLGTPITPEIATCLYTAILADTGGFRFGNTDTMTFRVASALVECGADPASIAGHVYESRKPASVRLTGEVYAGLRFEFDGQFVWAEIRRDLYERVGGEDAEPEGLSSDIRGIAGVEVSALFYETPDHQCRLGLRSKSQVNVSQLAQSLGGGGHYNASGALIREPYETARDKALAAIRAYLAENL
jgi:bifunctional oligoribonuclease and PAP phosphatase NrnA